MQNKVHENPVIGDKVVFLKTSAETNGECSLLEIELAPGGGNSKHIHTDFTETFTPVSGDIVVFDGEQKRILKQGETATIPVNTPHYFQNPSGKAVKFLVELRPGHTGFENSLKIAYGLAKDGLTNSKSIPKNFDHLSLLATMSGTIPSGIFALIMPLMRRRALKAKAKGIEQELMDRYCR